MVDQQLATPHRGIKADRVLEAMNSVPQHRFVPERYQHEAYEDHPLPIGYNQTISQPFIVALMTELLDPQPGEKVLEIGTGSGYQAAILSRLVKEVYSIEIVAELAVTAEKALASLSYDNVHVKSGDGYQGWPDKAPFDAIIVTCAPDHIPEPFIDQLKDGGRMIIPFGKEDTVQELYLLEKKNGKVQKKSVLPVRFVPMTGEAQEG